MDAVQEYPLPPGIDPVEGPNGGLRLRGPAQQMADAVQGFRSFKNLPEGTEFKIGEWTLKVSELVQNAPHLIAMPGWAWGFAAGVLGDVPYGGSFNPFDFGRTGPLDPPLERDIGVEVIGDLLQ
jgi:hypothetical protein